MRVWRLNVCRRRLFLPFTRASAASGVTAGTEGEIIEVITPLNDSYL